MLKIWTDHGFDLFFLWRWVLAVSGGVYTLLRMMQSVGRCLDWLEARDRLGRIRRRYVTLQLLRLRLRDYWWELVQIAVLVALLVFIIRGHYSL